jgi:hypothetical protein
MLALFNRYDYINNNEYTTIYLVIVSIDRYDHILYNHVIAKKLFKEPARAERMTMEQVTFEEIEHQDISMAYRHKGLIKEISTQAVNDVVGNSTLFSIAHDAAVYAFIGGYLAAKREGETDNE